MGKESVEDAAALVFVVLAVVERALVDRVPIPRVIASVGRLCGLLCAVDGLAASEIFVRARRTL